MSATVVDTIYEDLKAAGTVLASAGEISAQIALDSHARKAILLGAASFFEMYIARQVIEFTNEVTSCNNLVCSFVQNKAISRQYHTWFDWSKNNANQFFGLFGQEFRAHMLAKVRDSEELTQAVQAFMEIGRERNLLVHSNYANYPLEKTPDEIYALYKQARVFVNCLSAELRSCSLALRESRAS